MKKVWDKIVEYLVAWGQYNYEKNKYRNYY